MSNIRRTRTWPGGPYRCGRYTPKPGPTPVPEPGLPETVRRARRVKQQLQYQRQLWAICKPYLGSDAPMRVLCQRVERFLPELFTFVAEPFPPAERAGSSGGEQEDWVGVTPFGSGEAASWLPCSAGVWNGRNPYAFPLPNPNPGSAGRGRDGLHHRAESHRSFRGGVPIFPSPWQGEVDSRR